MKAPGLDERGFGIESNPFIIHIGKLRHRETRLPRQILYNECVGRTETGTQVFSLPGLVGDQLTRLWVFKVFQDLPDFK